MLDLLLDGGGALFRRVPAREPGLRERAAFISDFYREMGYDAVCAGARDLAAGPRFLRQMAERGVPFLSANLYFQDARLFPAYRIFQVRGVRVGVVALTSRSIPLRVPDRDEISVKTPEEVLPGILAELQGKADLLVLLSNLSPHVERRVLADHPDFTLVISSGRVGATKGAKVTSGGVALVSTSALGKSMGLAMVTPAGPEEPEVSADAVVVHRGWAVRAVDFRLTKDYPEDEAWKERVRRFLDAARLKSAD